MSIRLPLQVVLSSNNATEVGAGSTVGGIAVPFTIPQDTDNIVVKMQVSADAGVSATLQTTDDGGTTWYDVARTSVVSSAQGANSEWMTIPVTGFGYRSQTIASTVATGSVIAQGQVFTPTGKAGASTLGSKQYSGLPIMSQHARLFLITQAALGETTVWTTEVKVNSQSATA